MTLVIVLAIAGFPVAVVLAWALELTPEGVRRTPPASAAATTTSTRARPSGPVTWGVLLLLVMVVGAAILFMRAGTRSEQIDAVAVLPFDDLSSAGDQPVLGAGIAEEILNALSKVEGLRVPSRTTTSILAARGLLVQEIGRELDVQAVLEGSIQKHGDSMRVTAQLIRVRDESHVWSERFDANVRDIFAVQDSIARAVVEAIGGRRQAEDSATRVRT